MIKFHELKIGDYVQVNSNGQSWQGEVIDFNHDEKEIGVYNGVQKFFFKGEDLDTVPVNDESLLKMNFTRHPNEDGTVKYMKGAFRMQIPKAGDFSHFEIWYRDEKRHILHPIPMHELQNHYHAMTKVHLSAEAI